MLGRQYMGRVVWGMGLGGYGLWKGLGLTVRPPDSIYRVWHKKG